MPRNVGHDDRLLAVSLRAFLGLAAVALTVAIVLAIVLPLPL